MQELSLYGIGAVPLIIALVQLAKEAGLATRLAPVLSLALGVGAGLLAQTQVPHPILAQGVVIGVAAGLSASGIYAGISKFTESPPAPAPAPHPEPLK